VTLARGTRLGAYEVVSLLGAGGMGEVYQARDTKLRRDVALKILPEPFAADAERLARFKREAQVLASLNHPHIAAIYGFEDSGRTHALVLELVEGLTLADRIAKRPLPLDTALTMAKQIAEALDAAHEKGIVHRDLKPANIKLTKNGDVKVLDFGLATAVASAAGNQSALVTQLVSQPGMIVGTAAYMSPEQARGQTVDKRTDIWAFGCVLFEILTGRVAFAAATASDTIAAILERQPDWDALPPSTSSSVRHLLARCLEKDPKHRFRDIGDVRLQIDDALAPATVLPPAAPVARFSAVARPATLVAFLAGVSVALGVFYLRHQPAQLRGELMPRAVLTRATANDGLTADPAISRDGALIAYASDRAGHDHLNIWIQQTAGGTPIQLTHDQVDEREPAFSPDGSLIAFRSERDGGGIYIVPTFGGQRPRLLVSEGRRPRFSPEGRSVAYWTGTNIGFADVPNAYRTFVVPTAGGTPREITGMTGMRYPVWSPDGHSLLVVASRAERPDPRTYNWWIVPVEGGSPTATDAYEQFRKSGESTVIGDGNIGADTWQDGRVLFSDFSYLWSIGLDQKTGLTGDVTRLTFGTANDGQPAVSAAGTIAFSSTTTSGHIWSLPLDPRRALVTGTPQRLTTGAGSDSRPSSSRDGQRLAYLVARPRPAVFVRDLQTGSVTDLGVTPSNFGPAISPDGRQVAYEADGGVSLVPSAGGSSRAICRDCRIGDWTEDSRAATIVVQDAKSTTHLALVNIQEGTSRDLTPPGAAAVDRPFLAPSRRLVAFRDHTNANAVLVARVLPAGVLARSDWVTVVPPELDTRPCGWSPDGSLLYFVSSRDGARCLYAQRLDPVTGKPQGECIVVRHFRGARNIWAGTAGVLSTGPADAVRGGSFLYDLQDASSNIWTIIAPTPK
jgi:eukaryotic-like serine/threonine-protein kinase